MPELQLVTKLIQVASSLASKGVVLTASLFAAGVDTCCEACTLCFKKKFTLLLFSF